jgi:hypothetical protein
MRLMLQILIISITIFFNPFATASDFLPDTFKNFKQLFLGDRFNGEIYIDPTISYTLSDLSSAVSDPSSDEGGKSIHFTIKAESFDISYREGSMDPTYIINIQNSKNNMPVEILGERLFISSSGDFYVDGKIDHLFNARRKYTISSHRIAEVYQPFYLVDQICEINSPVVLTSERCGQGINIATLTYGTKIKVLLGETYDSSNNERTCKNKTLTYSFLVSSPFGLVGWVSTDAGSLESPGKPISCIRYWGD